MRIGKACCKKCRILRGRSQIMKTVGNKLYFGRDKQQRSSVSTGKFPTEEMRSNG